MKDKERRAIEFIQKAESLALTMNEKGFHLAFSGGKDSIVIYDLMKKSGCKFYAQMHITTVDPPELMKYVRKFYPEVTMIRPEKSMKQLIIEKGFLPLRQTRYCCTHLKETSGSGMCTVVGVRAAESIKRAKRKPIELYMAKKPKLPKDYVIDGNNLIYVQQHFDLFEVKNEQTLTCLKGKDKVILSPIFDWTDADVWNYIRSNNLPYCELYDMGFHRIGCLFCPMATEQEKARHFNRYKGVAEKIYIPAIRECMKKGSFPRFQTAEEVFMWWITKGDTEQWLENRNQYEIDFNNQECK